MRDILRLLLGRFNKGASTLIVSVTFVQAAQSRSHTTERLLPPAIRPTAALHNLGDITVPDWALRRLNASVASTSPELSWTSLQIAH